MGAYFILRDNLNTQTARGVANGVMWRSLGDWSPSRSRWTPVINVQVISNVSRALQPLRPTAIFQKDNWVLRLGRRLGVLVGKGAKLS